MNKESALKSFHIEYLTSDKRWVVYGQKTRTLQAARKSLVRFRKYFPSPKAQIILTETITTVRVVH